MNNVPTVFALSKIHQKPKRKPRRKLIRVNTSVSTANTNTSGRSNKTVTKGGKELTHTVNSVEGATAGATPVTAEPTNLEDKLEKLENELKVLSVKNDRLQTQIESLKFRFHRFIGSDDDMNYYTGMSFATFWPFSRF